MTSPAASAYIVTGTGFEPVISSVRDWRIRPLFEPAIDVMLVGIEPTYLTELA